jgi:aminomethyltransferase
MPVEYAGVLAEHTAVRAAVGLFDVSHLGTFVVEGPGAAGYLNTRLSNDLGRIAPGQAQYTLLLDAEGGVVDDMIVYLFSPDKVVVVPNAANAAEVMRRLAVHSPDNLTWTDRHTADAIMALQGPRSAAVMAAAGLPAELAYMSFVAAELALDTQPVGLTVCRTGYTGEHGYELVVPAQQAPALWEHLMAAGQPWGIQPCGLAARDTLRTELGYVLHGQDISLAISPLEARLGWAIGWSKPDFDGAPAVRAVRASGARRTLLGLRARGRGIPRPGMAVLDAAGAPLGHLTSGTFSPTLRQGIGLALLSPGAAPGTAVQVDIRGRLEPFEVVKPPFVASHVTDS